MPMFIVNTNVPRASVPDGFLSELTQQLAQATVHRGARGPGPAHGLRRLQRALRALQPAQHRQDRRRAEPLLQQAAVRPAGRAPAHQPGQGLHQLLRHERGQRGLEQRHLRLRAAEPHAVCAGSTREPAALSVLGSPTPTFWRNKTV
ncbi:macrophage migration inhibitory factor isoform X1 [Theropithecus gelada]|uniref:macrophage migration inhibitory factor isoform X1 n=1 Tax=Theropithecus gelada TaxID=9565 RepID=UPI000DC1ABB3|nr:macrophage migration inhibitory factor isoform X1 [Theropithecus gelada]